MPDYTKGDPFPILWDKFTRTDTDAAQFPLDDGMPQADATHAGSENGAACLLDLVFDTITAVTLREWTWNSKAKLWIKGGLSPFPGPNGEMSGKVVIDGRTFGFTVESVTGSGSVTVYYALVNRHVGGI